MTDEDWEIWFYDPGRELPGGVFTVDSQLRASLRRLTKVVVSRKTLGDLETFATHAKGFTGKRIALISHVDALSDDELKRLADVTRALRALADDQGDHDRPVHFSFIHRDPTSSFASVLHADDAGKDLRDKISDYESTLDRLVCIGPRMFAHLKSQWPRWGENRLIQLGAGMVQQPKLPVDGPMLQPMPRKSNVRVLFGSPTTPKTMDKRGLDIFARAAGLVQSYFVDRYADITFVVSGIEPDRDGSVHSNSMEENEEQEDLINVVKGALTDLAKEVFDGLTEFEVRPLQDRTTWLQEELDRADIFVLPSRDEPFGLVVAEALSMGKPVIVSQNSGIGEILLDYAADSFLPVEKYVCALTPKALARSIEAVIENDSSRHLFYRIAHGAYARLSWGNAVHQLLNALALPEQFYKPTVEISQAAAIRVRREFGDDAVTQDSMVLPIGQQVQPAGVRFNMPIAAATVIEEFDSNKGRRVTLETSGSTLFVRKVIIDPSHVDVNSSVSGMTSQWEFVRTALAMKAAGKSAADIHPRVYLADDEQLVMEYVDGGSLERVPSLAEAQRLTQLATVQLLQAARAAGAPRIDPTAWQFCRDELSQRCERLEEAVSRLSDEEKRELKLPDSLVGSCREFVEARERRGAGDPYIPLAIHGDFGMNNVVFTSDALRGDRIVFIDTRARWDREGRPRWDVAFDLATLYIFTAVIQPALAEKFGFGGSSPLHGQARRLATILERAVADTDYESIDRHWRERVEAACAIRLLGSISTQLASATSHNLQRAQCVAGLTEAFISRARPISWKGPR